MQNERRTIATNDEAAGRLVKCAADVPRADDERPDEPGPYDL